ncbi:MAG TPA: hypothetical protein VJ770_00590 [Stellaceae bacterium]|nr:hypothetical protein [Stellaceae bacterium]
MKLADTARRFRHTVTLILLAALFGAAGWPQAGYAEGPAPPPGYARIWIYRYYEPYRSLATPYVRFNGRIVGVSRQGTAFYRDVPPGDYEVTVDSEGRDVHQFARIAVAPGQQVYIETEVSKYWDCGAGARSDWCRDTFYTLLQLPRIGAAAVARLSPGGAI